MTNKKNLVFFDYSVSMNADIFYGVAMADTTLPPFWQHYLKLFCLW
jgi:hypothetical protein